jgi:GAF domain-containing protein
MALPLMVNEEIIGILDIQSTKKEAFTQEDVEILQTMADQIAFAIQNTRLLEESRSAVEELRAISISDALAAWRKRLQRRPHKYRYSPLGIFPVFSKANTEPKDLEGFSTLEIPITLRGRKIGLITLSRPVERPWNEREKDLAKNIGEQIGLAIENARLVEDTHARAQREELVSEISSRIRSTLDIDTVLQTAVQEIQKAFDLQTAEIQLGVPETELDTSSQGGTQ